MYAFYFQIQFHSCCQSIVPHGRTYILRVHTNYTNINTARNKGIEEAMKKWKCTRSDFTIEKVTLNSLLALLSFKDNVAQFGET